MTDQSTTNKPIISVVIPVFNDEFILLKCLNALRDQTLPKEDFEVIVVDNGSRIDVASFLRSDYPEVRCIREETSGSYHARNTGVKEAIGKYIAFTDADCIPRCNWLENALREFENNPEIAYIAGNIEVFPRNPEKPNLAERFEMRNAFRQKHYLYVDHFGATANVIVNKDIVNAQVGWFDEKNGRGDDATWGRAIWTCNLHQHFSTDASIQHPARSSLRMLMSKAMREQGRMFSWEVSQASIAKKIKVLMVHLRKDIVVPRWKCRWWLGSDPYTKKELLSVLFVGCLLHYGGLLEKFRIAFGGIPLPR